MKPYSLLTAAILLCNLFAVSAQEKAPVKFGKITPADFTISQPFDSGANAVVIADMGSSVFEGNAKGWFSLVYKRVKRIKVLNKNGFEAAVVKIELYQDGNAEEKLDDLKAYTYNLESGKVIESKLESSSVFKDKLDKRHTIRKFTLPAVKEGSIIEYSYTIKSDFLSNLQPWYFQDEYPCLWSEYTVDIPEFFHYVILNQGFAPLQRSANSYPSTFSVSIPGGADRDDKVTLHENVNTTRWIAKNIPALKEESYTSAIKNYVTAVEFQLSRYQFDGQMPHDIMGNWQLVGQKMMLADYFGAGLTKNNGWLDDDMKTLVKGSSAQLEKAQKIFAYLRDNCTCTANAALYLETTLKDVYKSHSGSVADINLLLVAMLRHEGITADPLILSTKDHGFTNEIYPLMDRFNYVVCLATIDGQAYRLDASSPYNGFNKLPSYCYNGHARVITKDAAMAVYFQADSLLERKMTTVFINNDEKGGLTGSYKSDLGYYESYNLRKKLKGDEKSYLKSIKSGNSFDLNVLEAGIDSLKKPDMPVTVHYDFLIKPSADESVIYFNPMMSEGFKENPFKSADRKYPVEMSYAIDDIYLLNMEVPTGYTVEEIPKSVKVTFNDNDGSFEYLIQKSGETIQMRTRLKLNKATFTPEDYNSLRDFFALIVKKQNEQIVLKKK